MMTMMNQDKQVHTHSSRHEGEPSVFTISRVRGPDDLAAVIQLFTEYAASLDLDLSFQDFANEMSGMPGKYAPEAGGELLIARRTGAIVSPPHATSTNSTVTANAADIRTQSPNGREEGNVEDDAEVKPGDAIGCVALRGFSSASSPDPRGSLNGSHNTSESQPGSTSKRVCEMKRLYTVPAARGLGLGRALATSIIGVANGLGYDEMRLDTLPSMGAAQGMYFSLGFEEIPVYRYNPVEGTKYLGLMLR